jgi:uncharacterized membrane protein
MASLAAILLTRIALSHPLQTSLGNIDERASITFTAQTKATSGVLQPVLPKISAILQYVLQFLTKASHAIKNGVLWLLNAPSRIAHAIANFFRGVGHTIADFLRHVGQFIVAVGRALLRALYLMGMGILSLLILIIVVRLLVYLIPKAYQAYQGYRLRRSQAEANRIRERYARESREEEAERIRQEQEAWGSRTREANERERERLRREEGEADQQRERDRTMSEEEHQRLKAAFKDWKTYREPLLDLKKAITEFPEPYADFDCADAACKQKKRLLKLCQHGIERLYRAAGGDLKQLLKDERCIWHPDKFSGCPADPEGVFYKKATELCQVINPLYDRL